MEKKIVSNTFPRVVDLQKEKQNTFNIIQNIFLNFPNEHNLNIMNDCLVHFNNSQDDYVFVPYKLKCWDGRYVAFINKKNPLKMYIQNGGFVTYDNGYSVSILSNNKTFKFNKKNYHVFMLLNDKDKRYASFCSYLK